MKPRTVFIAGLLITMMASAGAIQAETVIIPIQFRSAPELLPMVEGLLSPQGRAVADPGTNSIIITDTSESIQRIRTFIGNLDTQLKQVKIRLRFEEGSTSSEAGISAEGAISGEDWKISRGPQQRDGLRVRLRDGTGSRQGGSEFMIHATSGSPAYIMVGKQIPFRERWVHLCRRYAAYAPVDRWNIQTIESGMEVTPVVVGDHASVKILPRISHEVPGGRTNVVRFAAAATQLTVPLGQWVSIGAAEQARNEVMKAILESSSSREDSTLSISMKVEPD